MTEADRIRLPRLPDTPIRGYIEGYYGRLPTWQERRRIIARLAALGMNAYFYAPKEDPCHRVNWRDAWSGDWITEFSAMCDAAAACGVSVFAGIAPGLDYDPNRDSTEFGTLLAKALSLQAAGAHAIVVMFDDIEPPSPTLDPTLAGEIDLHAGIAARLAARLDVPTLVVPRIYADEISDAAADSYRALAAALPADMPLFHCGSHIVAGTDPLTGSTTPAANSFHQRLILWDNHYCNDYCPRRLFVGRHAGRTGVRDLMLNGTGMVETDMLLLGLMAAGDDKMAWREALAAAGVPEAFHHIAAWFDGPVTADMVVPAPPPAGKAALDAIETLLWRWKTPLAREWYPFLFGLKHDLQIASGALPALRIAKTQTTPLYRHLTGHATGDEGGTDD
ncbi:MAG: beta-N-acetylglucosaminidase domain-containing protein [Rhodobiaceae bacterium]